jgi:choline dehydrogenase-like flavoprotein
MIIDATTLPGGTALEADVCIIGAGPAGITMAREFDGRAERVLLLEAGNLDFDVRDQELYAGENIGLPYGRLDQMRSRYFGGSSNCWGGFCRPLDAQDFEARDWVPNSGWPFGRDELLPWYRRTHKLLELGAFDYDPASWERQLSRPNARCVPFDRDRAINIIAQLSPPTRFGRLYRDGITHSSNVTAYLGANVTEIEAPDNGRQVTRLQVRTRAGGTFRVSARTYVLATGGIEAARLLLCSDRYHQRGVGNEHDLVGRYFMDHPRLRSGKISFRNPATDSPFYDLYEAFRGRMAAGGTRVCAYFGLSPETQATEQVGNTRCYVVPRFVGDTSESGEALGLLYQMLRDRKSMRGRYAEVLGKIARNAPNVALFGLGLKFNPSLLARGFSLETVVEPTPLPESRVTLSHERDALGLRRARVDWRLGELEKRTIRRTQEILGEEMVRVGAGSVAVDAPQEGQPWPRTPTWCWHHMGTTRMHADPRRGVVDANCRVHGMSNLFIAGSSVFPTCGSDMPTITVVALALRLAAHLQEGLRATPAFELTEAISAD